MILHFIRPYWFWMLLPAFLYLLWVISSFKQHDPWKNVCDPHLLPTLMQASPYKANRFFYLTLFIFYAISIFALAGPSWKKVELPVYREMSSMMLVLDLSPAMTESDLKPNRLMRAKYKIRDLLNAAKNSQMGLVVFTEEAFTASPLSQDANTLNALLDELSPQMMPVSGSDSGQGLMEGHKLLKQAGADDGHLLLITASNPTAKSFSESFAIAKDGGHINVMAVLQDNNENQTIIHNLQQLAKTGSGQFYLFTKDGSDIQSILSLMSSKKNIKSEKKMNTYLWLDEGPLFCLLLVPIALLVLREHIRHEKR